MTGDPPNQDNFSARPGSARVPAPGGRNRTRIILAAVVIIAIVIGLVCYLPGIALRMSKGDRICNCGEYAAGMVQQPDNNTIIVSFLGGQDGDRVEGMTATVSDTTGSVQTSMIGSDRHYEWWHLYLASRQVENFKIQTLPVGEQIMFKGNFSGKDHVTAIANFIDGERSYIVDTTC